MSPQASSASGQLTVSVRWCRTKETDGHLLPHKWRGKKTKPKAKEPGCIAHINVKRNVITAHSSCLSDFMVAVSAAGGIAQVDFRKSDVKICKNTLIQCFYSIFCGKQGQKVKSFNNNAVEICHCILLNVWKKPKAVRVFIRHWKNI